MGIYKKGVEYLPQPNHGEGRHIAESQSWGPVIEHNPDSRHPQYFLSSTALLSFLFFFLHGGSFTLIPMDYIEVSARGREHVHHYLSSLISGFTSGSSHY